MPLGYVTAPLVCPRSLQMAKVGKKAPKWQSTVYHNGERLEIVPKT